MQWSIDKDLILGSSNPAFVELQELYFRGYTNIISLLDYDETSKYNKEKAEQLGFKIFSIQINDFSPPNPVDFRLFLRYLQQALKRGKVLVHCQGGRGRTGTMAAAYWISKGLSADQAINKVRQENPSAIENQVQELSLHEFERSLNKDE